ncbi:MAG TPA: NTP transferase domain-containing protein [Sphingomicrobium sp.]|nr:NTP transferase domain-containing protein [Sphingomicrobium sp.]
MTGITAIVLAGSRPGTDPFAEAHGTDLKALIPVSGVPMVRWPVDALLNSAAIGRIRVLAQQPERIAAVLPADPRLTVEQSGNSIAATLESFCFGPASDWPLLVTTGDHALLTPAMVAEFCARAAGYDLAIGVVERGGLQRRLPQSKRTWIAFRGGAHSGANLFMLGGRKVLPALEMWRSVEQDRKKVARLLWVLGPAAFLGALLRLRTLDQTLGRIGRRLGMSIRAVELSDPLACVDVDKEADLDLAEALLRERG